MYVGAPEFIVEVAASSSSYDLHSKLNIYQRNGVREYLVLLSYERDLRFFRLADGEYVMVEPDDSGVLRSQVLPGFWFRSDWFWEGRVAELIQLVEEGMASPEHQEFGGEPGGQLVVHRARICCPTRIILLFSALWGRTYSSRGRASPQPEPLSGPACRRQRRLQNVLQFAR